MQVLADGAVQQHGGNRGVHAARKPQHDLVVSDLLAQFADGRLDEALRRPRLCAAADAHDEIPEQLHAVGRVVDLRMELDGPRRFALDAVGGHVHLGRRSHDAVAVGHAGDRVTVRHPHLRGAGQSLHAPVVGFDYGEHRPSVFTARGGRHLAAEVLGEVLRAVADAQQRQPALDRREVDAGGFRVAHGEGRARENHAAHRRVDGGQVVEGVDFAVNAQLAYAAGDELRVLRAEVDD